jgi:hypothetical protein
MKVCAFCFVLALTATLSCTPAQSQSTATLDASLPARYGTLSNVVELSNGRVLFADTKNKLFLSADLSKGHVDTLGTRVDTLKPEGPVGQYKFPGWVAHLAGDTVALIDFSVLRTTLWNEQGRPLKVLPVKQVAGNAPVLAYDTVGHGYKVDYQAVLGGNEPGRPVRPDSIPVLRIALASGNVDTIARLAAPEYGDATFGEQTQQAAKVFAPNDLFGVLPDGTAWVARGRENRVDWRSPDGKWSRGEPHPFTKVPVTQGDKDRVLAQVREHGKQFGMPQNLNISYPFAETKPPFDFAAGSPNGEVWLQRPRARDDAIQLYDVFSRQGKWQREVTFPSGATLAGFGAKGAIYASIKDGQGNRTVGRLKLK